MIIKSATVARIEALEDRQEVEDGTGMLRVIVYQAGEDPVVPDGVDVCLIPDNGRNDI